MTDELTRRVVVRETPPVILGQAPCGIEATDRPGILARK
jgi:hypothetical protein